MQIEYEATFYPINKNQLRQKLKSLDAKLVRPEFLMKRTNFDTPFNIKGGWLRVRDEGDKITLSLKIVIGKKITAQKEIQLVINDYNAGCQLLKAIGCPQKAYQETKRELWLLHNVEITLDTWPGLKPLIEIEGKNVQEVKKIALLLGFKWQDAIFDSADEIYHRELGIPKEVINNQILVNTFKHPPRKYQAK